MSAEPRPLSQQRRRVTGPPTSSNGASSFHLWWELPPSAPLVEVAAVLEVLTLPAVERLYFWALQARFTGGQEPGGAGHLGLQWNHRYPGHGAVNWGGYAPQSQGGGILQGSPSRLPSTRDDPNTRDYPWQPRRPYRLRVYRSPHLSGAWRGEVTDLAAGEPTVVRDLYARGTRLEAPLVWSEVFADCDAPSVTVRWSELQAAAEEGTVVTPRALRVSYQRYENGGCDNTTVAVEPAAVLQVTNARRAIAQGATLQLSRSGG
ncbi:MAG: hypothetical protein ACE5KX_03690 [Acidimicrobiia bacterium]